MEAQPDEWIIDHDCVTCDEFKMQAAPSCPLSEGHEGLYMFRR